MTIENLKQIAIKYATTKGSRVPLAPDELCNAVVQYMNSFFGVMTDINTIKVAVTENSGNIVFTITGNTYDGKPITPIVITVDHNDFVTDQEFEEFKTTTNAAIQKNTESINSLSFRVEDTENDITTIQVQVGQINTRVGNTETDVRNLENRVDNTETNIAEINSTLYNKLDKNTSETQFAQAYIKLANGDQEFVNINQGTSAYSIPQRSNIGRIYAEKGAAGDPSSVANMSNIADVTEQLNNKLNKITSPLSNFVLYANIEGNDTQIRYTSSPVTNSILYRNEAGTTAVVKGVSGQDVANMENIADLEEKIPDVTNLATKDELNNKRSVISSPASSYVVYTQANGLESNLPYSELANQTSTNIMARRANGTSDVKKGISGENVANMENIADLEEKIPDVTNLATKDELNNKLDKSNWSSTVYIVDSQGIQNNVAYTSNPSPNTCVWRDDNSNFVVNSPTENGNPTPKSYVDNALTNLADVAKENTFTDVNHFTQYITSFGVEIGTGNTDDDEYDISIQESGIEIFHYISGSKANSLRITENKIMTIVYPSNNYNIFGFPNKSGTLALTSDIIKNPIYFISFYATDPIEPCHLIGTMMSKNSYGTGQKTNEEFAVMLTDNLYTNSNEGLAAYGRLANKDILCIYSEDGLSIRCLDEENSEVDLPTVMFFVMETEL